MTGAVTVYPAAAAGEEDARTVRVRPESEPGDVEAPVLIAELKVGSRHEGAGVDRPDPLRIRIEEEYVIVILSRATPSAAVAGKPHVPYHPGKLVVRVADDTPELFLELVYPCIDRSVSDSTSPPVRSFPRRGVSSLIVAPET